MVTIKLTSNNFSELPILRDIFGSFDNNQEYTAGGIFCRKPLNSVLNAMVSWFIMVTTYTPKKAFSSASSILRPDTMRHNLRK